MNANYMSFLVAIPTPKSIPIRINTDRMQATLASKTFLAPQGLTRDQMRKFIIDAGKE